MEVLVQSVEKFRLSSLFDLWIIFSIQKEKFIFYFKGGLISQLFSIKTMGILFLRKTYPQRIQIKSTAPIIIITPEFSELKHFIMTK